MMERCLISLVRWGQQSKGGGKREKKKNKAERRRGNKLILKLFFEVGGKWSREGTRRLFDLAESDSQYVRAYIRLVGRFLTTIQ